MRYVCNWRKCATDFLVEYLKVGFVGDIALIVSHDGVLVFRLWVIILSKASNSSFERLHFHKPPLVDSWIQNCDNYIPCAVAHHPFTKRPS